MKRIIFLAIICLILCQIVLGSVTVNPNNPHTLVKDGTPFLLVGDTQWSYSISEISWPDEFKTYVNARSNQGFNYIHGVAYQTWAGSPKDAENEGGVAFFNNDPDQINDDFWDAFEQRVAYMNEKGIVVGIVLAWSNDGWAHFKTENQVENFAQYMIDKFSSYDIIWILAGEYEEADIPGGYNHLGQYIYDNDPNHNLITVHPTGDETSGKDFGNEEWYGIVYQQMFDNIVNKIENDRQYNKPVINSEFGYEEGASISHDYYSADDIRRREWEIVTNGGFFVYGHDRTYHYNADMSHNNLYSSGAIYTKYLKEFFEGLQWWELEPQGGNVLTSADEYVAYIPNGGHVSGVQGNAVWYNPRNGETTDAGNGPDFNAPDGNDWVLHVNGEENDPPPDNQGDVNNDNKIDIQDLIIVAQNFGKSNYTGPADLNNNGKVDILDLIIIARIFGKIYG